MKFKLNLILKDGSSNIIPINYQYPLSAAIYKIVAKGDAQYAHFLHEKGYGKGYKFFTFSDLKGKFKVREDRMHVGYDGVVEVVIVMTDRSHTRYATHHVDSVLFHEINSYFFDRALVLAHDDCRLVDSEDEHLVVM